MLKIVGIIKIVGSKATYQHKRKFVGTATVGKASGSSREVKQKVFSTYYHVSGRIQEGLGDG